MYKYTLRWRKSPFASVTIVYEGTNEEHLKLFAWEEARQRGWVQAKWWEIWRWFDFGCPTKESGK